MVYVLRNVNTGATVVMGVNSYYTFGRSRINSVLLRDYSCSHKHAVIQIKDGYATIFDVDSKWGTYLNKQKIYDETKLRHGDIIRFGTNQCKYSFNDPKFQTVVDGSVSGSKKFLLHETLKALNVTLSENYSTECSHYTTEVISLDILKQTRILDAVIDQKRIVTAMFWVDIIKNIQEAVEIPNIYKYMPQIEDALKIKGVEKIIAKKNRKELFRDKLCIYFGKSLEKNTEHLIGKCGGKTIQHNNEANFAMTLVEEFNFDEAIIITDLPEENEPLTLTYFIDKLRQCDKNIKELSEDDVYIAVLNGYLENIAETKRDEDGSQNRIKNVRPVNSGASITIKNDSDDQESASETVSVQGLPASKNTRNGQRKIKEKSGKINSTTLNRWIRPAKKLNTRQQVVSARPAESKEELDISLEMSSSSSEEQDKELPKNRNIKENSLGINSDDSLIEVSPQLKKQNKLEEKRNGHRSNDHNIIVVDLSSDEIISKKETKNAQVPSHKYPISESSDSSSFERRIKLSRPKKNLKTNVSEPRKSRKRAKKKCIDGFTETEVVTGQNSKKLSSELKERLEPSTSHKSGERSGVGKKQKPTKDIQTTSSYNTAKSHVSTEQVPLEHGIGSSNNSTKRSVVGKKGKQPLEQVEEVQETSNNNSVLESSESFNFQSKRRTKPNNNDYFTIQDDTQESTEAVFRKSKVKCHKDETSSSSDSKPEIRKKRLKVNPLAKLQNTSTPKTKESESVPANIQRLNKLFKDVEIVPL